MTKKDKNKHITIIDAEYLEQQELKVWCDPINIPDIDEQEMQNILDNPPVLCDELEACYSHEISGDYCRCIRSVFKHEEHYLHFLDLVRNRLQQGFEGILTKGNKPFGATRITKQNKSGSNK